MSRHYYTRNGLRIPNQLRYQVVFGELPIEDAAAPTQSASSGGDGATVSAGAVEVKREQPQTEQDSKPAEPPREHSDSNDEQSRATRQALPSSTSSMEVDPSIATGQSL